MVFEGTASNKHSVYVGTDLCCKMAESTKDETTCTNGKTAMDFVYCATFKDYAKAGNKPALVEV